MRDWHKDLKAAVIVLAAALIVSQAFRIDKSNPTTRAEVVAPPEVGALLHRACYGCHSYETSWPWYAHVAPVSWWVVGHVKDGRDDLNFSDWPHDKPEDAVEYLDEIVRDVEKHKMPLPSYTWMGMHKEARLTEEQRGRILKWAEDEAQRLSQ